MVSQGAGGNFICPKKTEDVGCEEPDDIAKNITDFARQTAKKKASIGDYRYQTISSVLNGKGGDEVRQYDSVSTLLANKVEYMRELTDSTVFNHSDKLQMPILWETHTIDYKGKIIHNQQSAEKIGPLIAMDTTSPQAVYIVLGRAHQSVLLSRIMLMMKCDTLTLPAAMTVFDIHRSLYAGYLKDQANLEEGYDLEHTRNRDYDMDSLQGAKFRAYVQRAEKYIKRLVADSKCRQVKKVTQTDPPKCAICSSLSALSKLKNVDDRERHPRQGKSSISTNHLGYLDEYISGVHISNRSISSPDIGHKAQSASRPLSKKLSKVASQEDLGKSSLGSTICSNRVQLLPSRDQLRDLKHCEGDSAPVPGASASGTGLHIGKELPSVNIDKSVDQRTKSALLEDKSQKKRGYGIRNIMQSAVDFVQLWLPSKLRVAFGQLSVTGHSRHRASSDLWDSNEEHSSEEDSSEEYGSEVDSNEEHSSEGDANEEHSSEEDSGDHSGSEVFNQNNQTSVFSGDSEFTRTPADIESSHHSHGSNVADLMSSNGITGSVPTPAHSLAGHFRDVAAAGVSEGKREACLMKGRAVSEATAPKCRSDADLAADCSTDTGEETTPLLLELANGSFASSLDDEDISSPTRVRYIQPVTASSPDCVGGLQWPQSNWIVDGGLQWPQSNWIVDGGLQWIRNHWIVYGGLQWTRSNWIHSSVSPRSHCYTDSSIGRQPLTWYGSTR